MTFIIRASDSSWHPGLPGRPLQPNRASRRSKVRRFCLRIKSARYIRRERAVLVSGFARGKATGRRGPRNPEPFGPFPSCLKSRHTREISRPLQRNRASSRSKVRRFRLRIISARYIRRLPPPSPAALTASPCSLGVRV